MEKSMTTLREAAQQALEWAKANSEAVFAGGGMAAVDGMNAWSKALRDALEEPEPYDQTALELCEVCGWKTLIPDEGCLNCERQPKAEQEPVGTYEEVMQTMRSLQTGTLEQQQAFALLKDKPLYAAPQPKAEQKPVAWIYTSKLAGNQTYITRYASDLSTYKADKVTPLHTAPQPRKRLTDQEIDDLWELWLTTKHGAVTKAEGRIFARAIEAAVWGEKT
jgi:hypothetical protein